MYQGSEPPDISQSPVPLAFIAGITFQATLTTRAVKNAIDTIRKYEFSSHHTLKEDFSLRGATSPKTPLEEKKNAKKFSQKPKKNHVKDSMNPPWENREGSSFPISWRCPME